MRLQFIIEGKKNAHIVDFRVRGWICILTLNLMLIEIVPNFTMTLAFTLYQKERIPNYTNISDNTFKFIILKLPFLRKQDEFLQLPIG